MSTLNDNLAACGKAHCQDDHDDDLEVIVVRTKRETNFEEKMKKKTRTSGCGRNLAGSM